MVSHTTRSAQALHRPDPRCDDVQRPLRFVVVGTQRSGTTYLRQCLDSHPQVDCRGELFARSYGKSDGYHAYRSSSALRQLGHYAWRGAQVASFMNATLGRAEMGVEAIGFKLMRSHVRRVPYEYSMLLPQLRRRGYRVIHVIRKNLLRVLVSRRTALARGQFHARTALPAVKITLPIATLLQELEKVAAENRFWATATSGAFERLEVEYEQFVADQQTQSQRMLGFLKVNRSLPLHSPHKQVNRAPLAHIVGNYTEVAATLAGTHYAQFLEEE
ncbi:MAG: sulfotransferase [Pseudomonadota bacterium]